MSYSFVVGANCITIILDGQSYMVERSSSTGDRVVDLLRNKASEEELLDAIMDKKLKMYAETLCACSDGLTITDTNILLDDEPIPYALEVQIRSQYELGISVTPMVNFIRKLRENPSYRIREQLWGFIEASQKSGGFTIDEDGDIIAYKLVGKDFKDLYTHTFDNSPGTIVEMKRSDVDDDPNNTCSAGLHFCAFSYLKHYGVDTPHHVVLVKVNPKDVVSIPTDYNNAKARCCRYEVLRVVEGVLTEPVYQCGEKVDNNPMEKFSLDDILTEVEDILETYHPLILEEAVRLFADVEIEEDFTELDENRLCDLFMHYSGISPALYEDEDYELADFILNQIREIAHELTVNEE